MTKEHKVRTSKQPAKKFMPKPFNNAQLNHLSFNSDNQEFETPKCVNIDTMLHMVNE